MRKLGSVQRIVAIDPIPGADMIEKATVLGWECVVAKKDNFKVGDLVIYVEVDSIMPDKPEFEFLRERKFRVRTIKLRKQVSQGLVLPLSTLPGKRLSEGDDVTELLGIRKYDPEGDAEAKATELRVTQSRNKIARFLGKYSWFRKLFFTRKKKEGFPKFISKTDETRIQVFPNICEREKYTKFSVTEKIDGQSLTVFLVKDIKKFLWFKKVTYVFGVCSRNLLLRKPDNSSWWTIAKKYNLDLVLQHIIGDKDYVAIQGEIIGPDIQGNKYRVQDYELYVFNVIYPDGKLTNLQGAELMRDYGIKFVPIITDSYYLKPSISENVEYSRGKSVLHDTLREGVVVRNYEKGISLKIINPDFLLKHEANEK